MGLFSFFNRNQQQDDASQEKYWSLTTNKGEVINPAWEEIKAAVENVTPDGLKFASLGYVHSGLEIETIQVVRDSDMYRFEALPKDGTIFVNDGISYEESLKLFEEFFHHEKVVGYRSWPKEK